MKRISFLILAATVLAAAASAALAQTDTRNNTAVLYSPIKYPTERKEFCFNFRTGAVPARRGNCDLRYGMLYAGRDWDWFETAVSGTSRNVIKDLGAHKWSEKIDVPIVEPLARLKPGEQRNATIDVSGKPGADGRPGENGEDGADGLGGPEASGSFSGQQTHFGREPADDSRDTPDISKRKNDGSPNVSGLFTRAVPGHMYVIHVVNDSTDFYALFRVESVERGDNCTITWTFASPPAK